MPAARLGSATVSEPRPEDDFPLAPPPPPHPSLRSVITGFALAVVFTGACDSGGDKPDPEPVPEVKKPEPKPEPTPEPEPVHEPDPKVTKAAEIAKEIEAKPEEADEILAKHELDRDKFEAMIKEIAKDPQMSSDYEDLLVGA